ncbi:MAG: sodium:calcium antiporter [Dehalococcoidia bacterium]|nr:sodium:calcium antiporter [Dehalococcoidia bacterium]
MKTTAREARNWAFLAISALVTVPGLYLRIAGICLAPQIEAVVFGMAILGAAFLVAWACEVAQLEISQSLALALVALVAVLPEYAVDAYLAWTAGSDPGYIPYVTANMTGANRLLVGIGWSMVALLFCAKKGRSVEVEKAQTTELSFLVLATLYSFVIPLKGTLSLVDSFFLVSLFILYMWSSSRGEVSPPEITGPALNISRLGKTARRSVTAVLFIFAAVVILGSAEPFAEGLIGMGRAWGIEEFILVQWLAPLASEAPEIAIALIFVLGNNGNAALGTLVSSKVNQWTLLVGTLPIIYSISMGGVGAMPLDGRQIEEILLTSAQSLFAISLLARMRLSRSNAIALFLLFITQLVFPNTWVRYGYSALYLALSLYLLLKDKGIRSKNLYAMMRQVFAGFKLQGKDKTG